MFFDLSKPLVTAAQNTFPPHKAQVSSWSQILGCRSTIVAIQKQDRSTCDCSAILNLLSYCCYHLYMHAHYHVTGELVCASFGSSLSLSCHMYSGLYLFHAQV